MNATEVLEFIEERSTVNSSALSVETGWINVLLGPMTSRFGKLFIRIVSLP